MRERDKDWNKHMKLDSGMTEVDRRRHGADDPPLGNIENRWVTRNVQLVTAPGVNGLEDC